MICKIEKSIDIFSENEDHIAHDLELELFENEYIELSVQVNLYHGTIEAKASLDYCVSAFKEDIDYDNFEDQCKRAIEAL